MSTATNLRATGDRIELRIAELRSETDEQTARKVEELLGLVTELYGAGLARIIELASADADVVERMASDDVVGGLLCLHDLHPHGLADRVNSALQKVRPTLAAHGGGVELMEIDGEAAAVRLRLTGSCDGCPSSAMTLRNAVEAAILQAAPEIMTIDVDLPLAEPITVAVELGARRPRYDACPTQIAERL